MSRSSALDPNCQTPLGTCYSSPATSLKNVMQRPLFKQRFKMTKLFFNRMPCSLGIFLKKASAKLLTFLKKWHEQAKPSSGSQPWDRLTTFPDSVQKSFYENKLKKDGCKVNYKNCITTGRIPELISKKNPSSLKHKGAGEFGTVNFVPLTLQN